MVWNLIKEFTRIFNKFRLWIIFEGLISQTEILQKYKFQHGHPNLDEKLSFQIKDMVFFSAGGYTSNDVEGYGLHKNDARFVEDCGSRSSGYQSGTSSIVLDNSPIKTI